MYTDIKILLSRPLIAKIIFFSLLILMSGQFLINFFSLFSHKSTDIPLQAVMGKKMIVSKNTLSIALQNPLFGDYVPKNLNDADIKQSMLNLTVVGVMFAPHEEDSLVMLRAAAGREQTYHVGDVVPGGAVIKRVLPDGVLVGRDGSLESLSLPKKQLIFDEPASALSTLND